MDVGVFSKRKIPRKMDLHQTPCSVVVSPQKAYKNKQKKKKGGDLEDHGTQNEANKRYAFMSFWELPEYMKDNEFILRYYRVNWPLKEALFSIFRWHNETLNIWTHLLGFLLFGGLTMANVLEVPQVADLLGLFTRSILTSAKANVSNNSKEFFLGTTKLLDLKQVASPKMDTKLPGTSVIRWPFYLFLGGSMFCLFSSSICHLFSCHSRNLNIILLRIDYVGITTMIITSFFPPIFYIFQCDSHWQYVYLGGITAMGIFTIITLLSPTLSTGKCHVFRALLFCSMGLFGIVPAVHASIVNWSNPKRYTVLAYESSMALFYLTGTGFYISRIPERLKPGWFDLACHSHQIFHVFVVLGALAHYGATLVFLEYRDRVGC
ncbi:hypothetical protein GH714_015051 [Hevea brasiliensis]|uniref:Heptahelical transmembrane protein 1-like n=2 Tax=Hevea brasiliensis TaxID=3981 RepID=A0A6A6MDN3_HEVBR|nr:hypothetical protein GH714_015051 [Hevea brasiliensis]